jgi:predicted lipid-binding transport protein (Tim44 family)
LIVILLSLGSMGDAYAKRLGGGSSFGSRPSYSQPYRAPSGANPSTPSYQPSNQNPRPATPPMQPRGSGIMGMLGGLAVGGLLGAMLFGHGFQGINFLDILIFAGIAFLLFKLFAGRRQTGPMPSAGYGNAGSTSDYGYQRQSQGPSSAGFDTDILSRKGGMAGGGVSAPAVLPADFDQAGFLNGAKTAYAQMQRAWDSGDLADLRGLTTDKVFGELQDQIRARQGVSHTELLKVDASILEVRDVGSDREVSVLFDVMMNEDGTGPTQVREVWHFTRPRNARQPTWFLDGIQQWED